MHSRNKKGKKRGNKMSGKLFNDITNIYTRGFM